MKDSIMVDITPNKLKLAYDEFLKVASAMQEDRKEQEFFISLGNHEGKHIILRWLAKGMEK